MGKREDFINEVEMVNDDIILKQEMISIYLKHQLTDEYVVGAYNNIHNYDYDGNMLREDSVLIFTNKRAYFLKTHDYDSYINYEDINYLKSDIENENTNLEGLIFISFGKESNDKEIYSYEDTIFMRLFVYYDNAKIILEDIGRIMESIQADENKKILPLKNENSSILRTVLVDEDYFKDLPRDEYSKRLYKEMLKDGLITREQLKLII